MPMNPINHKKWLLGLPVYEVTRRSGSDYIRLRKGVVTKVNKTRLTVTFDSGAMLQFYDRGWEGLLNVMGDGQRTWSAVSVNLYPADHEDLPVLKRKSNAHIRQTNVQLAAKNLNKEVNASTVESMERALSAWKAGQE